MLIDLNLDVEFQTSFLTTGGWKDEIFGKYLGIEHPNPKN